MASITRTIIWLFVALSLVCVINQQQQVEATFFVLGNACALGLDTLARVAAGPLEQLDIEEPLQVVSGFCRGLARFSIPGVVIYDVAPILVRIVRLVGRGSLELSTDALPEVADLIREAAEIIQVSAEATIN